MRDLRERKAAEDRIHFLAHHDPLTRLPNRTHFGERFDAEIARARLDDSRFAVLCFDLDRFKDVNDVFGHDTGDTLLATIASRLSGLLGPQDIMARLGGDEFAIVQRGMQPEVAVLLAEEIIAAMTVPVNINAHSIISGVSIGIAIYPDDGTTPQQLMARADMALYRAKNEGRGVYRLFELAMDEDMRERRAIAHDLRHALARNELELNYQPLAEAATAVISGFEALLRWNHPSRGAIPPAVFVPIAEDSGLILQLGEWVLREACREAAGWTRPLTIAVNLSPIQFQHGDLAGMVAGILKETGLPAHRLELEITEAVLVRDLDRALIILNQLKDIGVSIAMDDFGTGYSSLKSLQAFPFDKIKIDKSFVDKIGDQIKSEEIVRSVLGLGKSLNIPVVAEGVETEGQLDFLNAETCQYIQGYLLSRPQPIRMFAHVVGMEAGTDDQKIESRVSRANSSSAAVPA